METYRGSCHCGAVSFVFQSEKIVRGVRCNCSICTKKGAIMSVSYFSPDCFLELKGLTSLTTYIFGDRMVNHHFCKVCGVYPFHDAIQKPGRYRINLDCVEAIDRGSLIISRIDGRSF